jgi:hypothetical protein
VLLGKLGVVLAVETVAAPTVLLLVKLAPDRVLSIQNQLRQRVLLWMYPGLGPSERASTKRLPSAKREVP